MIDVTTFKKLVNTVREGTQLRYGQATWNTAERLFQLTRDYPLVVENDPFYNDEKVDDFITTLVEMEYLKW